MESEGTDTQREGKATGRVITGKYTQREGKTKGRKIKGKGK